MVRESGVAAVLGLFANNVEPQRHPGDAFEVFCLGMESFLALRKDRRDIFQYFPYQRSLIFVLSGRMDQRMLNLHSPLLADPSKTFPPGHGIASLFLFGWDRPIGFVRHVLGPS